MCFVNCSLEFLCNFYSINLLNFLEFLWNFSTPSLQNLYPKEISQNGDHILLIICLECIETQYLDFVLNFYKLFFQNFSEFSHHQFSTIWNGWPLTRPIIWNVSHGNFLKTTFFNLFSFLKIKIENVSELRD